FLTLFYLYTLLFCSLMLPRPPISTLFPYTTLFRSLLGLRFLDAGKHPHADVADVRPGHSAQLPHDAGLWRAHLPLRDPGGQGHLDRKSTRLNSSHVKISYAVFCLKKKKKKKKTSNN